MAANGLETVDKTASAKAMASLLGGRKITRAGVSPCPDSKYTPAQLPSRARVYTGTLLVLSSELRR